MDGRQLCNLHTKCPPLSFLSEGDRGDKKAMASPRRQLTQIHEDKKFVENNMVFLGEMNAC